MGKKCVISHLMILKNWDEVCADEVLVLSPIKEKQNEVDQLVAVCGARATVDVALFNDTLRCNAVEN